MKIYLRNFSILIVISLIIIIIAIKIIYKEPKIPVINYHNVVSEEEIQKLSCDEKQWNITVDNFEDQMKYLHDNNYKTLTMKEFTDWKQGKIELPFKSVLVTFDDGLLSNFHYAIPILSKYKINATIFVIGKVSEACGDSENEWQSELNSYISKKQIIMISKKYPNIEFFSHTYDIHRMVNDKPAIYGYTEKQMEEDIIKYEKYMGKQQIIAYPFGATNEKFNKVLKRNGYKYGFLLGDNKKATREDDNMHINRINTSANKDILHFAARLLLPY